MRSTLIVGGTLFVVVASLSACALLVGLESPEMARGLPEDAAASEEDDVGAALPIDAAEEEPPDVLDVDAGCTVTRMSASPLLAPTRGGGSGWSNPDAIKIEDDKSASESGCCGGDSQILNAAAFGFAIPATAEIRGVKVVIRMRANIATLAQDRSIKLTPGEPDASAGVDLKMGPTYPTSFETRAYGDDANLWGLRLTPAIVNSPDFGVAIRATHNGLIGSTTHVDAVRMTVIFCRYP